MRWHEAVSHPVRVSIGLVLKVSFEAADKGVKGFGVVPREVKLNAGGVENKHL